MRILGLDTTGDVCSAGILDDGVMTAELSLHDKNTHSVNLMPMVDACLKLADISVGDIDAFAVNIGPGSFTGIRIGVCTVKGLAMTGEKPCIAVNTLDALAYQALPYQGIICPMIDARRTESYFSVYENNKDSITRIREYSADKLDVFLKTLPEGDICVIGDGADRYRDVVVTNLGSRAVFMPKPDMLQNAGGVLKAAKAKADIGEFTSVYDLMPYYHRKSQAERMKNQNGGGIV